MGSQRPASLTTILVSLLVFSSSLLVVVDGQPEGDCTLHCLHDTECVPGNVSTVGQPVDPITEEVYFHNETNRNGWKCDCPPGLTGLRCGRKFESCDPDNNEGCYHGGTCLSDFDQYGNLQFFCDCTGAVNGDKKYVGKYCEFEVVNKIVTECTDDQCLNGGSCRSSGDDLELQPCQCLTNYTGAHCEYDVTTVPACDLDCGDNGVCRLGLKPLTHQEKWLGYTSHTNLRYCDCQDGYTGDRCEHSVTVCGDDESMCLHGSECVNVAPLGSTSRTWLCDCEAINDPAANKWHAGRFCQYTTETQCQYQDELNLNAAHYCVNGGTCPDADHLDCQCEDGYDGPHCEFTQDEMSEDYAKCDKTCDNGGRCRKGFRSFGGGFANLAQVFNHTSVNVEHCICPTGWIGESCDEPYEVCGLNEHVCFNGANCMVDSDGKQVCDCDSSTLDVEGSMCEHVATDKCMSAKPPGKHHNVTKKKEAERGFCVNGGVCHQLAGFKYCDCDGTGYVGAHCEVWGGDDEDTYYYGEDEYYGEDPYNGGEDPYYGDTYYGGEEPYYEGEEEPYYEGGEEPYYEGEEETYYGEEGEYYEGGDGEEQYYEGDGEEPYYEGEEDPYYYEPTQEPSWSGPYYDGYETAESTSEEWFTDEPMEAWATEEPSPSTALNGAQAMALGDGTRSGAKSGLKAGGKFGIVIVVLSAVVVALFFWRRRRHRIKRELEIATTDESSTCWQDEVAKSQKKPIEDEELKVEEMKDVEII